MMNFSHVKIKDVASINFYFLSVSLMLCLNRSQPLLKKEENMSSPSYWRWCVPQAYASQSLSPAFDLALSGLPLSS